MFLHGLRFSSHFRLLPFLTPAPLSNGLFIWKHKPNKSTLCPSCFRWVIYDSDRKVTRTMSSFNQMIAEAGRAKVRTISKDLLLLDPGLLVPTNDCLILGNPCCPWFSSHLQRCRSTLLLFSPSPLPLSLSPSLLSYSASI